MKEKGRKVVLFGTGDFARVAHVYLKADSPHEVVAFTVDGAHVQEPELRGLPVIPFEEIAGRFPPDEAAMFVAVGFKGVNRARAEICGRAKAAGYELLSYVNSRAMQWGEVTIGENCFVFEGNVLQPFVTLGDDVILWSGNHVGHDVTIGDHVFVASHAVISGRVTIGPRCFVGVNATLRDGVTVGADCVIGAGALILKDTEPGSVHAERGTEAMSKKSHELASFR